MPSMVSFVVPAVVPVIAVAVVIPATMMMVMIRPVAVPVAAAHARRHKHHACRYENVPNVHTIVFDGQAPRKFDPRNPQSVHFIQRVRNPRGTVREGTGL
jgi:hypothetical protein